MRVQTNILCDENLKIAAKEKKISMSEALEEMLRIKLSLPTGNKVDIAEKIKTLEGQIEYLKSADFAVQKKEQENHERREWEKKQGDIKFIHGAWVRQLNGALKAEKYNVILKAFCQKWNCTLDEAVALAMSKSDEKEDNCPPCNPTEGMP